MDENEDKLEKEKFREAMDLLRRINERKIYKYICGKHFYLKERLDIVKEQDRNQHFKRLGNQFNAEIIKKYLQDNGVQKDSIGVQVCDSGFGLKSTNPLRNVSFFSKETGKVKKNANSQQFSMMLTQSFLQRTVRVYSKKLRYEIPAIRTKIQETFEHFWTINAPRLYKEYGIQIYQSEEGKTQLYGSSLLSIDQSKEKDHSKLNKIFNTGKQQKE